MRIARRAGRHNPVPGMKQSDLVRRPIDRLTAPLRRFLRVEAASGLVLGACTVAALVLAHTPAAPAVHEFWHTPVVIGVGQFQLNKPLEWWVNDALMTLFFFVVGLEIKRELVAGELSSVRKAALPVIGALGGMVVPAGLYLALQGGEPGERGWGIPMATDIAFVVGVLAVFGKRVPLGLKVFLLSLAIADDIGAIIVIAIAYSAKLDGVALGTAAFWVAATYGLRWLGVRSVLVYAVVSLGVWLAVLQSGVHPTITGVVLGLLTPTGGLVGRTALRLSMTELTARLRDDGEDDVAPRDLELLQFAARESVSPVERLETALHPWVGFVIMPVFALANAGVEVKLAAVRDPVAVAVAVGLVLGKPVGIVAFSYLAVRSRLAVLPAGVNWLAMAGAGALGGIGFTMSLFVAGLAFEPGELLDAAKIGILCGSSVSAVLGSGLLLAGLGKKRNAVDAGSEHADKRG
jgi:NhaA family Na+:H+ antiporter